jgi:hypothetical protein
MTKGSFDEGTIELTQVTAHDQLIDAQGLTRQKSAKVLRWRNVLITFVPHVKASAFFHGISREQKRQLSH